MQYVPCCIMCLAVVWVCCTGLHGEDCTWLIATHVPFCSVQARLVFPNHKRLISCTAVACEWPVFFIYRRKQFLQRVCLFHCHIFFYAVFIFVMVTID